MTAAESTTSTFSVAWGGKAMKEIEFDTKYTNKGMEHNFERRS